MQFFLDDSVIVAPYLPNPEGQSMGERPDQCVSYVFVYSGGRLYPNPGWSYNLTRDALARREPVDQFLRDTDAQFVVVPHVNRVLAHWPLREEILNGPAREGWVERSVFPNGPTAGQPARELVQLVNEVRQDFPNLYYKESEAVAEALYLTRHQPDTYQAPVRFVTLKGNQLAYGRRDDEIHFVSPTEAHEELLRSLSKA